LLQEIQPASVRAVCYRLFVAGAIESMKTKDTQKVSRWLTIGREEELIPWSWIVDETREVEVLSTWDDPANFARSVMRGYRRGKWAAQEYNVEVWSEKGTVRGTLKPVLDRYEVPFRVMHGFGSATAMKDAADMIEGCDRDTIILYVGDWDPSGLWMSNEDIPERLTRYTDDMGDFEIERVALVEDDTPGLPSFEAASKIKDPRYHWFVQNYGARCWELDAMNPNVLRARVEDAILGLLDRDIWDRYVAAEAAERASIEQAVSTWNQLKSGLAE
jgi:hypothetical protein